MTSSELDVDFEIAPLTFETDGSMMQLQSEPQSEPQSISNSNDLSIDTKLGFLWLDYYQEKNEDEKEIKHES